MDASMALDLGESLGVGSVTLQHPSTSGLFWHPQHRAVGKLPLGAPVGAIDTHNGPVEVLSAGGSEKCEEKFFTQTLDHFRHVPGAAEATFQQRYYICSEYWGSAGAGDGEWSGTQGRGSERAPEGARGPIFFYAGNEADVSLYLGATGLMWENAEPFKALLIFAEHRFYGESLPFDAPDEGREYLSTSQALADYAFLIRAIKEDLGAEESPVIAFGGSYGGMLASWLRLKYPHIINGAIAASAPVLALEGGNYPTPDPESFAETVTRSAGPAGGAAMACAGNVRHAFSTVLSGIEDATAAGEIARLLRICPGEEPQGEGALLEMAWWARAAFDYLSMGNYPYETGYILNDGQGLVKLPAWPLRVACSYLADPELKTGNEDVVLSALAEAIGVYYNATGAVDCFSPAAGANNESAIDGANWNWQACTEMSMPMSTDGMRDMFWDAPWDPAAQDNDCLEQFGVSQRAGWGVAEYGGYDAWSQVTNVVFSNGRLDPWSGMGVLDEEQAGPGIHIIVMDQAAHHLDLFFENPFDPEEVVEARRKEMDLVEDWVRDGYGRASNKASGGKAVTGAVLPSFKPGNIGLLGDW